MYRTSWDIAVKLKIINERFDAYRPPRLRVRVRSYAEGRLSIAVSDAGKPARRRLVQLNTAGRIPYNVLHDARRIVFKTVDGLYDDKVAVWFMKEHGETGLAPDVFEPCKGMNLLVVIPHELIGSRVEITAPDF